MSNRDQSRASGEDVQPISMSDLPPADTTHWVVRRKAILVAAVQAGLLSVEQVCERYGLSREEFASWQRAYHQHGSMGLRVTRTHEYRKKDKIVDLPSRRRDD